MERASAWCALCREKPFQVSTKFVICVGCALRIICFYADASIDERK